MSLKYDREPEKKEAASRAYSKHIVNQKKRKQPHEPSQRHAMTLNQRKEILHMCILLPE